MHIVHVITRMLRAGSEENTWATCVWQANAGHRVTLVHGAEFDPAWYRKTVPGITLQTVPQMVHAVHPFQDARALRALRHLYAELCPDVIHTHQSKAGILGRLAANVAPQALVVHGIHIVPFMGVSSTKRAIYIAAEKRAALQTDLFFGVSHAVGQAYVDAGIAYADQMRCVRSGMDLDRFRAANPPDDWRNLLGVSPTSAKPMVAVMLAALEPRKRHVRFLNAFARVAKAVPHLKVVIAGVGPEEQAGKEAVRHLGLEEQAVFAGFRTDPEALLALADVAVLTSEREGLPRVAVQAVAAGVPVVMCRLPGITELIGHGHNGLLCDTVDEVADALVRVVQNDVQRNRLRQGAQATNVNDWSLTALGANTTALYAHRPEPERRAAR